MSQASHVSVAIKSVDRQSELVLTRPMHKTTVEGKLKGQSIEVEAQALAYAAKLIQLVDTEQSPMPAIDAQLSLQCFSLENLLLQQKQWSEKTFGEGRRTKGITAHIRKELEEIERAPEDLEEWIDVALLSFDGAWRTGASPEQIVAMLVSKQAKNMKRSYPMPLSQDHPSEHDRSQEP